MERLASRKFILAAFSVLVAAIFLQFGTITPEIWSSFTTWVLALYIGGNVGERFVIVSNPNIALLSKETVRELAKD
jgi:hypothetical protein